MALKHILKHTETEIVFKCYVTDSAGGNVDLSLLTDMTKATQEYVTPVDPESESDGHFATYNGSRVYITGIWWGLKSGKQLDITRILNGGTGLVHSHYYLMNAGFYDWHDFADRTYAGKDLRLTFDGPGHCILRLRKEGWVPKVETSQFSIYDNVTAVGS